ncbi:MAG: hypothetical protein QN229_06915 [Desulfurococcaceae archaeon TW002]
MDSSGLIRRKHMSLLTYLMLLTASLAVLIIQAPPLTQAQTQIRDLVLNTPYVYSIPVRIAGNLSVTRVLMINKSVVMVVASGPSRDYVALLDVSNPYSEAEILQLYPLVGRVTSFSTDGWPTTRVSIGTNRGEVLLFSISGGRIYKMLEAVLGADFYVRKTVVLRTQAGGYKVAALVSEGPLTTGTCTSCYVYVFSEGANRVLKIGGRVGNATVAYEGVLPQDIAPLTIFSRTSYYYDASSLVIAWIKRGNLVTLVFNVTYWSNNSLLPASNALTEVIAYDSEQRLTYKYGFNADERGVVEVPVPRGLVAQVTVRDIYGGSYNYTYNTSVLPPYVDRVYVTTFVLDAPPITTPASYYYRIPEFLLANLEVLDVSRAPENFTSSGFIGFKIIPTVSGLSFLKGINDAEYLITYYDPEDNYLKLARVSNTFVRTSLTMEYVGTGIELSSALTLHDGSLAVLVLSDSRVKVYSLIESGASRAYRLFTTYVAGGRVSKVKIFLPSSENQAIFLGTSEGLQVLRLTPYLTPLLRRDLILNFAEEPYVDSDILSDFSVGVTCSGDKLTIIKNLNLAVGGEPILLGSFKAGRAVVKVVPPGNESVTEASVTFKYPGGSLTRIPSEEGVVIFDNILPNITYEVIVTHSRPYVSPAKARIEVKTFRDAYLEVPLTYKEFTLYLSVSDSVSGDLIAPYSVIVDNKVVIPWNTSRYVKVRVLYGTRSLKVVPAQGFENVYESFETELMISGNQSVDVTLFRKIYLLEVRVEDALTTRLIAPVEVEVGGEVQTLDPVIARAYFVLPYGNYTAYVRPLEGYEAIYRPTTINLTLASPTTRVVRIFRNTYTLSLSIRDATINILRGSFDVYANNTRVASNVTRNTNIVLPYGVYVLQVRPTSEYEVVYNPSQTVLIKLTNDTSLNIPVTRKYYNLRVRVQEGEIPVKNAEVRFYSLETGNLITTLNTYEEGFVETKLFYGDIKIEVVMAGYFNETRAIILDRDTDMLVYMSPQPLTLFFRYLPVAAVIIIAALAVYGTLKLRAIIYQRLRREETLF